MSSAFPKKIDKNFNARSSSIFWVLSQFWVFLSEGRLKTQQQLLTKNIDEKSKADLVCFIAFLGVPRGGEFENTTEKYKKIKKFP
jgi:hypothetical protein